MSKILTTTVIAALILSTSAVFGQDYRIGKGTKDGGLGAAQLSEIEKGYTGSPEEKALRNALNTAPINTLAVNADAEKLSTEFSDVVPTSGITDQKSSGRCWLFSGLNVLRAKMSRDYGLGDFTFSQNYLFFWDQLEKANLFLQGIIDTRDLPVSDRRVDWLLSSPINDGGQFTGIIDLVTKYGLVPSEVMPESLSSNSTSQMASRLKSLLRQDALELRAAKAKDTEAMKTAMLKDVYHILALCLGVPPKEFTWKSESYTPKSFYDKYIGKDLAGTYVMMMNDPLREYYKVYEVEYDRHMYDGHNWTYVNLPMEDIKKIAASSIKGGDAMYFSCDVNKFLDRKTGISVLSNFDYSSLLGVGFTMDKKQRVLTHDSASTHAMTLIGVNIVDGKPDKWLIENSWGASSGWNGKLIAADSWMDEYMFRLVAERKYIPENILKIADTAKPELLPAWDPLY